MTIDWYPLLNSLRIAAISCVLVFFSGIFFAYYAHRLPRTVKGLLDVVLTLPMVLPPTVCGYFLLLLFGAKRPLGIFLAQFGVKFVMTWYGGVLAAAVVAFPLMYRTARGAFNREHRRQLRVTHSHGRGYGGRCDRKSIDWRQIGNESN